MASALKTHAIIFQGETTHCETGQETQFPLLHMQNRDNMAEEACYFKLNDTFYLLSVYIQSCMA